MKTTDKHVFFWNGIYSQWFQADFEVDGIKFNCAEQYMMYKKALTFNDVEIAKKIMNEPQPNNQKALGRKVSNFDVETWERVAKDVVYKGNYAKFTQNTHLLKELMSTGDRIIVEASPVDKIWGIGMHENDEGVENQENWKGKNWLGEVLTKLRDDLKKEA